MRDFVLIQSIITKQKKNKKHIHTKIFKKELVMKKYIEDDGYFKSLQLKMCHVQANWKLCNFNPMRNYQKMEHAFWTTTDVAV